jgi:uroporphyrinogen decarboxylase
VCTCPGQADTGAQVIQIFDSWASELMPQDFDVFAGPYIKKVINSFRWVRGRGREKV